MTKLTLLSFLIVLSFSVYFCQNTHASKQLRDVVDDNRYECENNKKIVPLVPASGQNGHDPSAKKNFTKQKSKSSDIGALPQELIIHIARYLGGENFRNFANTSKEMREIISKHKDFFPDNENLIRIIQQTNIEHLDRLIFSLGRIPKSIIVPQLETISSLFQDHDCEMNQQNTEKLEGLWENFETFIKAKNIKWNITDNYQEELMSIYNIQSENHGQALLHHNQDNSFPIEFIQFSGEKLSLLCYQYNDEYCSALEEGWYLVSTLEQDVSKLEYFRRARKTLKLLNLKT